LPDITVSSPEGSAGEGDGLSKAFEAALGSVELDNAGFHPAAGDPVEEPNNEPASDERAEPAAAAATAGNAAKDAQGAASDAPPTWDAKRREAFGKLSPDAKALVLEITKATDSDYTRKSQELADDRKYAQSVRSLVTDEHRQMMQAGGFRNEVEGIAHLVKLNDWAAKDFPGYVRWAVQQWGGDPRSLFSDMNPAEGGQLQQQQQPARPSTDPQVYETLRALAGRVDSFEQERRRNQERSADQVITRFRDDKDEAGNPRHPHFAQVESTLVNLLTSPAMLQIEDMGERLQRAYDTAVAMDPSIRTQIFDSEVAKRLEAKRKEDDLAKARRAKAPVRSPSSGPVKAAPKTLDDTIRTAMGLHGV